MINHAGVLGHARLHAATIHHPNIMNVRTHTHIHAHCVSHQCQSNKLKHLTLESVVDHKVLPRRAPSPDMPPPSCKTNDGRYCCQGARLGWWMVGGGLNTLCVYCKHSLGSASMSVSVLQRARGLQAHNHTPAGGAAGRARLSLGSDADGNIRTHQETSALVSLIPRDHMQSTEGH